MEELRKMSAADRTKLMIGAEKEMAQLNLNLRTGKEKQSHMKDAWLKQAARIQTLNNNQVESK